MNMHRKILFHFLVLTLLMFPLFFVSAQIKNPLSGNDNLLEFFNTILDEIIIPIGAILAAVFIIYSGFLFVTAGGSDDKIKTAKTNLLYVVIGAAIILGAKAIAAGLQATVTSLQ